MPVSKSRITYRVIYDLWFNQASFDGFCRDLEKNRTGYDDLAFLTSSTHSVIELTEMRRRTERLAVCFRQVRERGLAVRTGINLLCAVGHLGENLPMVPQDPGFQPLIVEDGTAVPGCFCMSGSAYRVRYLTPLLQMFAGIQPDFIWLDDDCRCTHKGQIECFCDDCMRRFNLRYRTGFTRETLRNTFIAGTPQEILAARRRWLEFAGDTLTDFFTFAANCVHACSPAIQMGAMQCSMRPADSASFDALSRALYSPGAAEAEPRWRPGGGAYTDSGAFEQMTLGKATLIGSDAAYLPDRITDIEAEIESFNYQRLRKSPTITAYEAALYCAAGATGTAWNILASRGDEETNADMIEKLAAARPIQDRLVAVNGRTRPVGVCGMWRPGQTAAADLVSRSKLTRWNLYGVGNVDGADLFGGGIPVAYRQEEAEVYLMAGSMAWDFSDSELRQIFRGGVLCDAPTLKILEERNLSDLAGFRAGRAVEADAVEYFLGHPLNGSAAGRSRESRQNWPMTFPSDGSARDWICNLEPCFHNCETLSELRDYREVLLAPCASGVFRNQLGGRVVVSSYFPFTQQLFAFKLRQMKLIFHYLAGGSGLAGCVESYHRTRLFIRPRPDGGWHAEIVNATDESAENAIISVRGMFSAGQFFGYRGEEAVVPGIAGTNGRTTFVLPRLAPWSVNLISIK